MGMHTRRELLKAGLAATGVLVAQTRPVQLSAEPIVLDADKKSRATPLDHSESHQAELAELVRYRNALAKLTSRQAAAAAVPYATMPTSLYSRRPTTDELEIPEPQIPLIHNHLLLGLFGGALEAIRTMTRFDSRIEVVEQLSLQSTEYPTPQSVRVITPMHCVDVEEEHFGMRVTAKMLIEIAAGIGQAWTDMLDYSEALRPTTCWSHCQVKPIRLSVIREAFMLSIMGWNTGVGFATSEITVTRPIEHILIDLHI